ncbi:MAG: hypothetical protein R2911_06760 [Caldilineaceae bacterium]
MTWKARFGNPTPKILWHYLDETINGIFALTGGNPYLLQVMRATICGSL